MHTEAVGLAEGIITATTEVVQAITMADVMITTVQVDVMIGDLVGAGEVGGRGRNVKPVLL
jgi:hypothetical protein